jgi:hypothetical protein
MQDARMSANLLAQEWSARPGVNLWAVELITTPLVQGIATYSVNPNIIAILDLYVTVISGSSSTNRYIMPISRSEYASYAQPSQSGFPTTYWFDRLLSPSLTFWPVPDGNEASFSYYAFTQLQDMNYTSGQTPWMPTYAMRAFGLGLAHELSVSWAPEKEQMLDRLAKESYATFVDQNVETANFYISPQLSSYWRT